MERVERKLAAILAADIDGYTCPDQHETKRRDFSA
jgi:hypothetical protein